MNTKHILFHLVALAYFIGGIWLFFLSAFIFSMNPGPNTDMQVIEMMVLGLGLAISFPLALMFKKRSLEAGARVLVYTFIFALLCSIFILRPH